MATNSEADELLSYALVAVDEARSAIWTARERYGKPRLLGLAWSDLNTVEKRLKEFADDIKNELVGK